MDKPRRVTEHLLDVLEVLVEATSQSREVHGYEIMQVTRRLGPTIYGVLDKLEDLNWISGRFEERNLDHPGKPARRFYRLTVDGVRNAEQLLHTRRPVRSSAQRGKAGWAQALADVPKLDGAQ